MWTCVTCGHAATEAFCAHCGEKRRQHHDFSLRHIIAEAVEAFFHVDSKIFLSLRTLVRRPGRLTKEFFAGRRKPYMAPLQLFLVCNLIFFVLQPFTGMEILGPPLRGFQHDTFLGRSAVRMIDHRLQQEHISPDNRAQYEDFARRFYRLSHLQAKSMVLIMVPMLAAVLAAIFLFPRRFFSEHVMFALHAYAWWLLWVLAMLTVMALVWFGSRAAGTPISAGLFDMATSLLEFGGFGVYLFFAMRSFYGQSTLLTVGKALALTAGVYGVFQLYRMVLLFTILHTL